MGTLATEIVSASLLFAGVLVFAEAGRAFGLRPSQRPTGSQAGYRAIENAVLALLGLLLAFTFSGAATRLDARRLLAIDEANAIGTAYLRLDILPAEERAAEQALLLRYLDTRISMERKLPDIAAALQEYARAQALEAEIWRRAAQTARAQSAPIPIVLWPALNEMFDLAATRVATTRIHPPAVVFAMLDGVALLSALMVGYALASSTPRGRLHLLLFAAVIAIAIFIIGDLEHPLLGLIRIDESEKLLATLRQNL